MPRSCRFPEILTRAFEGPCGHVADQHLSTFADGMRHTQR